MQPHVSLPFRFHRFFIVYCTQYSSLLYSDIVRIESHNAGLAISPMQIINIIVRYELDRTIIQFNTLFLRLSCTRAVRLKAQSPIHILLLVYQVVETDFYAAHPGASVSSRLAEHRYTARQSAAADRLHS